MWQRILTVLVPMLIAGVQSSSYSLGSCPDLTSAADFNVDAYMGTWYDYASFGGYWESFWSKCAAAAYWRSPNKTDDFFLVQTDLKNKWTGAQITCGGTARVEDGSKLNIELLFESGKRVVAPYVVLGTDYVNWAIVWTCKEHLWYHEEASWILSRNRTAIPEDALKSIDAVLAAADMDRNDYWSVDQSGCEDIKLPSQ